MYICLFKMLSSHLKRTKQQQQRTVVWAFANLTLQQWPKEPGNTEYQETSVPGQCPRQHGMSSARSLAGQCSYVTALPLFAHAQIIIAESWLVRHSLIETGKKRLLQSSIALPWERCIFTPVFEFIDFNAKVITTDSRWLHNARKRYNWKKGYKQKVQVNSLK